MAAVLWFIAQSVDENPAAIVATNPGQEYAWREQIPEDEAGVHRLLSAFRQDLRRSGRWTPKQGGLETSGER